MPVSIVSIGMGYPNADFFVREVRECLNGDMLVVRSMRISSYSSPSSLLFFARSLLSVSSDILAFPLCTLLVCEPYPRIVVRKARVLWRAHRHSCRNGRGA